MESVGVFSLPQDIRLVSDVAAHGTRYLVMMLFFYVLLWCLRSLRYQWVTPDMPGKQFNARHFDRLRLGAEPGT